MQLLRLDVEVTQDNEWCAVFRKAAEEGIHLIEVAEGARWTVDHCNVELDGKGDCHGVEFKRRSGQVF